MTASLSDGVQKELRALQKLARSLKDDSEGESDANTEEILAGTLSQGATQQLHTNGATLEAQMPYHPPNSLVSIISSSLGSRRKTALLNLSSSMSWSTRCTAGSPAITGAACASFYGLRQMHGDPLDVLAAALLVREDTEELQDSESQQEHTKVVTNPPPNSA